MRGRSDMLKGCKSIVIFYFNMHTVFCFLIFSIKFLFQNPICQYIVTLLFVPYYYLAVYLHSVSANNLVNKINENEKKNTRIIFFVLVSTLYRY